MKVSFKILYFGLMVFSHAAIAQYTPSPMDIRTPGGVVYLRNRHVAQAPYNNYFVEVQGDGPRYKFQLTLKDNSKVWTLSSILPYNNKLYVEYLKDGFQSTIYADETKSIKMLSPEGRDGDIEGIATDTCWLFMVKPGVIKSYSFLPEREKNKTIIAIQKGDGAIVALNKENLKAMMSTDDEKILESLNTEKLIKAIRRYNKLYPAPTGTK